MFFLKPKNKYDELLPPPPPAPDMEFEEEKEKPKFFDEIINPSKAETFPEEKEFANLVKESEEPAPKKASAKKERRLKKATIPKQQKPAKIKLKRIKLAKPKPAKKIKLAAKKLSLKPIKKEKIPAKPIQLKKAGIRRLKAKIRQKKLPEISEIKKEEMQLTKIRAIKPAFEEPKVELPEPEENLGLEDIDFELPKELENGEKDIELPDTLEGFGIEGAEKDIDLPDTLEELGIEDVGKGISAENGFENIKGQTAEKPKEILEAEEEIQSAIEKIKLKEKPSFLNRLFQKKEKPAEIYSAPAADNFSQIQNSISRARDALSRFDLKAAKRNYIEIMRLYGRIKPEEQAKVYGEIRELYFERKSAEELKV